jgi:hypothetical protein
MTALQRENRERANRLIKLTMSISSSIPPASVRIMSQILLSSVLRLRMLDRVDDCTSLDQRNSEE